MCHVPRGHRLVATGLVFALACGSSFTTPPLDAGPPDAGSLPADCPEKAARLQVLWQQAGACDVADDCTFVCGVADDCIYAGVDADIAGLNAARADYAPCEVGDPGVSKLGGLGPDFDVACVSGTCSGVEPPLLGPIRAKHVLAAADGSIVYALDSHERDFTDEPPLLRVSRDGGRTFGASLELGCAGATRRSSVAMAPTRPLEVWAVYNEEGVPAGRRSLDGGSTWLVLTLDGAPALQDLAVSPADDSVLLALTTTGDGLWRSVDAGESWEHVFGPPLPGSVIGPPVFAGAGGIAYAVAHGELGEWLVRSEDAGATWMAVTRDAAVNTLEPAFSLFATPLDEDDLLALGQQPPSPMQRTSDGGRTWQATPDPSRPAQPYRCRYDQPMGFHVIARSPDDRRAAPGPGPRR